ncbi:glucose-6-phosphate dehydrogenase [Candidatus Woesearchaeota archaeon]|nr:glucose-6-phosphate dehydrogenase [Candidatus Woesearchaeota archaeon]
MDVTFIILGATGDLNKRKLIPAIYNLIESGRVKKIAFVGLSRSKVTIEKILAGAHECMGKVDRKAWNTLKKSSYYIPFDLYEEDNYDQLKDFLEKIEQKHALSGNRIFYLATLPQHFDTVTKNLAEKKLTKTKGYARVVYEKPFGHDLKSAKKINQCINRVFSEDQVYRIDHYLGKELVGNIALMRFTNRILEPQWNAEHLESVQIIMEEKLLVGSRGKFYDSNGVLNDVVQNHALQLLALTAMEPPKLLTGNYIRDAKAEVLKHIKIDSVFLGQYEGYLQEEGVEKNSTTETFATLKLSLDNPRWSGVPFFIKAGKGLDKNEVSIHLKFKPVECLLSEACPADTNYLTMNIQPKAGFEIELNTKVPFKKNIVKPVIMSFSHENYFPKSPEAYENLLWDVMNGDQSVFVRNDEIEAAWKLIGSIKHNKVYQYPIGSKGPKELISWNKKHGINWRV